MPLPTDTLVHRRSRVSHHNAGLRQLYENIQSGVLPIIPAAAAVGRSAREKAARYPHGKRVGPYLLGKTIGEGSFAKVKEALHSVVGEKVAIKIIDKNIINKDPYLRKNMRREAGLLQSLRHHPGIISIYEVMETDNNFYMVLELCNGGALLDRICSEKYLSEAEARRHVQQIVSAVDHIHQAGILHRDLKVENLLLDEHGNIKIIDFGLSNFLGNTISRGSNGRMRAEFRGTQCGSPAYAAPEVIANKRYGPKVDVWSIGVNTFAMLAGCLPFAVEPFNIKLLLKKINNRDMAEIPSYLSDDCKDFIRKLLHPDPRRRPTILEVMNHRWLSSSAHHHDDVPPLLPSPPCIVSPPSSGRLSRMELETDILEYIWSTMGYRIKHVIDSVISRRADEYSAIYYLLLRKRDRHHRKVIRRFESALDGIASKTTANTSDESCAHKLYDEAMAMELAGHKNGSFHFKIALMLQQETNNKANEDDEGSITNHDLTVPDTEAQIRTPTSPLSTAPLPSTSSNGTKSRGDGITKAGVGDAEFSCPGEDSENITQTSVSFSLNCDMPKEEIESKVSAAGKIRSDWAETTNKVTRSISDMERYRHGKPSNVYKLATARRVNLTFKQPANPSNAFANHFNYQRKETSGRSTKTVFAPTRGSPDRRIHDPKLAKSVPKNAEYVDSNRLENRMNGMQITPRSEYVRETNKKAPVHAPDAATETITVRRRQHKVYKRKSLECPTTSTRRPIRAVRKRSLMGGLTDGSIPPYGLRLSLQALKRKTTAGPSVNQNKSRDRVRPRQKSAIRVDSEKPLSGNDGLSTYDSGHEDGKADQRDFPECQAALGSAAAPPLTKQGGYSPKKQLINRRPVLREVSLPDTTLM